MSRRRRFKSFSMQRRRRRRTPLGVESGRALQSGSRSTMAARVSVGISPAKGARPVSIS